MNRQLFLLIEIWLTFSFDDPQTRPSKKSYILWSHLLLDLLFHFLTIIIKVSAKNFSNIFSLLQSWLNCEQLTESRLSSLIPEAMFLICFALV